MLLFGCGLLASAAVQAQESEEDILILVEELSKSFESSNYFSFVVLVELLNVAVFTFETFDCEATSEWEHT